jgi:hypothetical protein
VSAAYVVDVIHWGFAFFVVLCALLLGWVQMGRRVMNVVIGIQILIGIVYAAVLGASIAAKGEMLAIHVVCALAALAAYIVGRRLGERPNSRPAAIMFSAIGFVLVLVTAYLGLKTYGRL